MQRLLYSSISKSDLMQLFGVGDHILNHWITEGLPSHDERFILTEACRWIREFHEKRVKEKLNLTCISTNELSKLTGRSRQTVHAWHIRHKMPRNPNGTYSLAAIMQWFPKFYDAVYKKRHQQIARKMAETLNAINSKH